MNRVNRLLRGDPPHWRAEAFAALTAPKFAVNILPLIKTTPPFIRWQRQALPKPYSPVADLPERVARNPFATAS